MDSGARRELEILQTIAEGRPFTQRALARRLGIALGLTNLYLKRLTRKGYIKIRTIPPHRIRYLVTPRGVAEKTRLAYDYLRYSLRLYGQARETLRTTLTPLAQDGVKRIALYGTGEAAEVAYLTLKELGLEPVGVFDRQPAASFLGMRVRPARDLAEEPHDRIIVATFEEPARALAELAGLGLPRERLIFLRDERVVWRSRRRARSRGA